MTKYENHILDASHIATKYLTTKTTYLVSQEVCASDTSEIPHKVATKRHAEKEGRDIYLNFIALT